MKNNQLYKVFTFLVLFALLLSVVTACGSEPSIAPKNETKTVDFVFCGHETTDALGLVEYPQAELEYDKFLEQEDFIRSDAEKTKTLTVNGRSYDMDYTKSSYRFHQTEPIDVYRYKSSDLDFTAQFSVDEGKLCSLLLLSNPFISPVEDLSENGEAYFQEIANKALKEYFGIDYEQYRVSCVSQHFMLSEDSFSGPEYPGFVSESQSGDMGETLCVKHYRFVFTKYIGDMPTEEYAFVMIRQDGALSSAANFYPGRMDPYMETEIPEKSKIEAAAEAMIKEGIDPEYCTIKHCKTDRVILCLDADDSLYYRVEVKVELSTSSDDYHFTDTVFLKPVYD